MFSWGKLEWNMSIIIREGEVVKKTVIDSERLEICAVVTIFRVKVSCISSVYGIKQSLNEFKIISTDDILLNLNLKIHGKLILILACWRQRNWSILASCRWTSLLFQSNITKCPFYVLHSCGFKLSWTHSVVLYIFIFSYDFLWYQRLG